MYPEHVCSYSYRSKCTCNCTSVLLFHLMRLLPSLKTRPLFDSAEQSGDLGITLFLLLVLGTVTSPQSPAHSHNFHCILLQDCCASRKVTRLFGKKVWALHYPLSNHIKLSHFQVPNVTKGTYTF